MAVHMSPIQRDALLFLGSLFVMLVGVWVAVSWGVQFGPDGGVAAWSVAVMLAVVLLWSAGVVWWYYVFRDEREPARGEFTIEDRRVRVGKGSWREKALGRGALEEPSAHVQDEEPMMFPRTSVRQTEAPTLGSTVAGAPAAGAARYWRTRERTGTFVLILLVGVVIAGIVVLRALRFTDPLSPILAIAGLLAVMLILAGVWAGDRRQQG